MNMTIFLQAILDGVMLGGIYGICAVGLSLSYGVMRVMNWAQGDCVMMSLYMAIFLIGANPQIHPLVASLILAPIMFIIGFLIMKYLLNPLVLRAKEREPLSVLLTTAGISYVLSNAANYFFKSNSRRVVTLLTGKTIIAGSLFISVGKLISFIVVVLLTIALQLFLQKTEWGRALRATSQDRETAQLMGMNNKLLYCLALAIGFACLGVAGGLMSSLYPVSPETGTTFGFKSLMVVVLGGKGSVPGALIGGIIVALIESIAGTYLPPIYANVFVFAVFAFTLFFKPDGLFNSTKSSGK